MEKFKATYEVDDGYAGGARPQHFTISSDELDSEMSEEELRELFQQSMLDDFEQKISPYGENENEFIEWAKEILAKGGK